MEPSSGVLVLPIHIDEAGKLDGVELSSSSPLSGKTPLDRIRENGPPEQLKALLALGWHPDRIPPYFSDFEVKMITNS